MIHPIIYFVIPTIPFYTHGPSCRCEYNKTESYCDIFKDAIPNRKDHDAFRVNLERCRLEISHYLEKLKYWRHQNPILLFSIENFHEVKRLGINIHYIYILTVKINRKCLQLTLKIL